MVEPLLIAKTTTPPRQDCFLLPQMANRHGLIAGATGTGKTVTLQRLLEQFSRRGVPVVVADLKGDLAGISQAGGGQPKLVDRLQELGLEPDWAACPVTFWDVFGAQGHPLRVTVSELGPLLLARLLDLNQVQTGVMQMAFQVADDQGLLLLDFQDLRALLQYLGNQAKAFKTEYGNISAASIGAIQRSLLALEQQGGDCLFGEPALDLQDWLRTDCRGWGQVNLLVADRLIQAPRTYSTLLLWLLSALYEQLPEVGDLELPKLIFVVDEAHLLFRAAPPVLLEKIEQVVRLMRSKGVGLYFCSQSPLDLPNPVLGQLGNRIQHGLRAFTPADQKVVKAVAQTFRPNPELDVEAAIAALQVGEALVSCLDATGAPTIVQRALIVPPGSQVGPISPEQRQGILAASELAGHYETLVDRESAYEILQQKATAAQAAEGEKIQAAAKAAADRQRQQEKEAARLAQEREKLLLDLAEGAAQALGGRQGKKIVRGVMGGILGYGTGRRR